MTTAAESQSVREQVDWISRMTPRQLENWIRDSLAGHDVMLEDDEEDPPPYAIVAITRHLSPVVKESIHGATTALVHAWVDRQDTSDAEELLLLVQGLRVLTARNDLEMVARSERFRNLSAHMRYRLLQTLIALDANVEPTFWYRAFESDPNELAGIAFDGLALVSPNHAIDFLSAIPDVSSIAEQIAIGLPGFMDNLVPAMERARIRSLIESRLQEMQPSVARVVTDFFAAEQTPLAVLSLAPEAKAKKAKRYFPISAENFPALASIKEGLDRLLGLEGENPAKMFANLAHQ